ncbi:MAG: LPD29 domain-containing protein [Bacteroidota bacterium]
MANYRTGVVFNVRKPDRTVYTIGATMQSVAIVLDVVWDDGLITRESPLDRWEVLPGFADADEIAKMLHDADQKQAQKEAEARAEKAENATIRASLPTLHPHLLTVQARKDWAPGRIAAENIRRELKRLYPKVKFSIRYKSFSGGNSIDVSWVDGPTSASVNAIIGKHEYGSFDGMTDCYNYDSESDRTWGDVFGSAKYVHASRTHTIDAVRAAWKSKGFNADEVPATDAWQSDLWQHMFLAWSETAF